MRPWGRRARALAARRELVQRLGVLRRAWVLGAFAAGFVLASVMAAIAVVVVTG